jgi:ribosome biogenesis GTPase
MRFEATVIRSTGSWYEVRDEAGATRQARIRGRLRLSGRRSTNPVVVGDRVVCTSDEGGDVWIEDILPRTNYVIRRASNLSKESHIIAANIDQALVVATLFSPVTSPEFIDRFLVTSEAYRIPSTIVLNKVDLAEQTPEALERFTAIYEQAGYRVIHTSTVTGQGVGEFREYLRDKTTLVSGNSGVGKSTLIKTVEPMLDIRIGDISRAHHKGMHTTTFSQMYPLSEGGYIIDTPGIKGFGLIDIDPAELARYFPDFRCYSPECQYYNCTHVHEPECAVQEAVAEGVISEERYISYLKMLEEDEKYRK